MGEAHSWTQAVGAAAQKAIDSIHCPYCGRPPGSHCEVAPGQRAGAGDPLSPASWVRGGWLDEGRIATTHALRIGVMLGVGRAYGGDPLMRACSCGARPGAACLRRNNGEYRSLISVLLANGAYVSAHEARWATSGFGEESGPCPTCLAPAGGLCRTGGEIRIAIHPARAHLQPFYGLARAYQGTVLLGSTAPPGDPYAGTDDGWAERWRTRR